MAAFKVTAALQETTRHNVRTAKNKDSQVFLMDKKPLSVGQISVSPPPNQTFLVVERGEPELAALRTIVSNLERKMEVERESRIQLERKVEALEEEKQSRNEALYRPVFSSRELAIVSLLMHQRNMLDGLVEKEVRTKAREMEKDGSLGNRRERKEARKAFLKQYGAHSYFQLARACENSGNQVLHHILERAERAFLIEYEKEGCECGEATDVRRSMRALRSAKKSRDQFSAHIFDFDMETGRMSIEERQESQKLQAAVLMDLQNAIIKDWLQGNFKTLGNPCSGTLVLEIARRIKELESSSGFKIADLAELP